MPVRSQLEITSCETTPDPHVKILRFRNLGLKDFEPGQWLSLKHTIGEQDLVRSYSLLTKDADAICVDLVDGGLMSSMLFDTQPGTRFDFAGPFGAFRLPKPVPMQLLMVGYYTGISPIHCLLQDLDAKEMACSVQVASVGPPGVWPMDQELKALSQRRSTIHYHRFDWNDVAPFESFLDQAIQKQPFAMIAGRTPFVKSVQKKLKQCGYTRKQFAMERFG